MLRHLLVVVVAFLASCIDPAAAATARRPPAESVRFAFAWPAGQSPRVYTEKSVRRDLGIANAQKLEYRLRATPADDGLRVAAGDYEFLLPPATEGGAPQRQPMPFTLARAASIPFVVDPQGRFLRLADVAGAQSAMVQAIKEARGGAVSDAALAFATVPATIELGVRELWDPIVGAWAGREFELDREYEVDAILPLPTGGGGGVAAKGRVYVHRAPDCERGGVARRCVYVEYSVRTEPGAVEAAVMRVMATLPSAAASGGADPASAPGTTGAARASEPATAPIRDASIVVTSTLLVEPDGLIPHEYDYEKVVRLTPTSGPSLVETTVVETERREFAFAPK